MTPLCLKEKYRVAVWRRPIWLAKAFAWVVFTIVIANCSSNHLSGFKTDWDDMVEEIYCRGLLGHGQSKESRSE